MITRDLDVNDARKQEEGRPCDAIVSSSENMALHGMATWWTSEEETHTHAYNPP